MQLVNKSHMVARQPLLLIMFLAYTIKLFRLLVSSSSVYKRAVKKLNKTVARLGEQFNNIVQILSYKELCVIIMSLVSS